MKVSASKRSKKEQEDSDIDSDDNIYLENDELEFSEEDMEVEHANDEYSEDLDEEKDEDSDNFDEKKDGDNDNVMDVNDLNVDNDGFSQNDDELDELEKEYEALQHQEHNILKNLNRYKDEDLLKGEAVKNQKALWDKALELRFLLQKVFLSSNRLPQEPLRSSFCKADNEVNEAYSKLFSSSAKTLESLLELFEAILEKNPSINQTIKGNKKQASEQESSKNIKVDEDWMHISQMQMRIAPFRDKAVDKWQRKTQVTTGAVAFKAKFQAFNQNISDQVVSYMRDPSRMIKSMQQRRSTVDIFGYDPVVTSYIKKDEDEMVDDGDPELLDDSEFYQLLLKEFFETIDPNSSEMAFYTMKKLQNKKRKIVDRRASKGRKIRYNVHEKIVNFMAPQPMNIPPMAPKLFDNLFGLKTQKPSVLLE